MSRVIHRHRTAIERADLSRPIRTAIEDGLLTRTTALFDYGCGRGGDLKRLRKLGFDCTGWDPVHRAHAPRQPADVVNFGYVVNVIEDPVERADTLKTAWRLARNTLVVSARLIEEEPSLKGLKAHGDGAVTSRGTFQKFYTQDVLRNWIAQTLDAKPIAAAPGVFYVFRSTEQRSAFLAERARRRHSIRIGPNATQIYKDHEETLQPIVDFMATHGRAPAEQELDCVPRLIQEFGRPKQAIKLVKTVIGEEQWQEVAQSRSEDLLVYLALSQFDGRPKLSELPPSLQLDVKSFFSSYTKSCALADELLHRLGIEGLINLKCMASEVGKLLPTALYVHVDALSHLPLELRLYEGCARGYIGRVDGATLVKLDRIKPKVTYLGYPDFNRDPHPALLFSYSVNLQTFRVKFRYFGNHANKPILHRKETFLYSSDSRFKRFSRLTRSEEKYGLFKDSSLIGYQKQWTQLLRARNLRTRGHKLEELKYI
ncbi:DNA phosphorothioation-associated putative methyltransferase [Spectribacter hydrogenoxidans]|uniref:DNA phosphorothioation-associated putative methyltransferase n=1 Tax=Spectribacter hydrogenoxidans TaxID=3075608 RepID=A0ABU3BZY3_9GAMM|nr:DNA phosphorothioation-associated putative methyltransferase [Salinisphaera sp. W335]MDT0634878.1 DNA phosphorothioation-associated putative methyltransferase [Salinisphaera sp. W335]